MTATDGAPVCAPSSDQDEDMYSTTGSELNGHLNGENGDDPTARKLVDEFDESVSKAEAT